MEYLNKREMQIKERLKNKCVTDEDVVYLLETINVLNYKFHMEEMKYLKSKEEQESLELVLKFQTNAKNKLILENKILLNDKNYLKEILKSISRIAIIDDKVHPDLDKIKNLADEALEGI